MSEAGLMLCRVVIGIAVRTHLASRESLSNLQILD